MQEHITAPQAGDLYSPIVKHMAVTHQYRLPTFKFMALTRVHVDPCGDNWDERILRKEALWICYLRETIPPMGLNDKLSYKPFLTK